jgi:hypothetical protein
MDPVKITIFLAAFGLLFLVGRALSSSSEVHAAGRPVQPGSLPESVEDLAQQPTQPALVGSEIEFPIQIPPVKQRPDGTFNRPIFTNYYFAKTDLVRGPSDPNCFADEFTLEALYPGTGERITYQYTVATPAGLRQHLEENRFDSLYIEARTVIIARWDLGLILRTLIDQIMQENAAEDEERMPSKQNQ